MNMYICTVHMYLFINELIKLEIHHGLYESVYSNKSKILDRRLRYLKDHFQYQLYDNVSRSIFAKHRGVFTFILCANLLL
jgi:hypothetical protein